MNINGLDIKLENITDEIILKLLFSNNGKKIKGKQLKYCEEHHNDIYTYLINRYPDSLSLNETLKRIKYNIGIHPTCPICGKPVLYLGKEKRFFLKTCSEECGFKLRTQEIKDTCMKKYNCINPFQVDEFKEKSKNTLLKKYGVDNPQKSKEIKEKSMITSLIRYGTFNGGGSSIALEKIRKTQTEHYGRMYWGSEEEQKKSKETKLKRYGTETYNNMNKNKESCLIRYGVESYLQSDERKQRQNEFNTKTINTKKKNKTYTTSTSESIIYNKLYHYFNKIICQYKSDKYPFACDFYIPEIDMYIEYNGHYTHHTHPFNENDINDINELNNLITLNKNHITPGNNLYNTKINVWTIVDVQKRKIAKENNLNFKEFYSIMEIDNFLSQYERIR